MQNAGDKDFQGFANRWKLYKIPVKSWKILVRRFNCRQGQWVDWLRNSMKCFRRFNIEKTYDDLTASVAIFLILSMSFPMPLWLPCLWFPLILLDLWLVYMHFSKAKKKLKGKIIWSTDRILKLKITQDLGL